MAERTSPVVCYGYVRDDGHLYAEQVSGDLELSMRVRGSYGAQYDQAGAMVRLDERRWLKTGVEYFDGRPRFGTVITLEYSSWAMADLPSDMRELALLLTRRGDAVECDIGFTISPGHQGGGYATEAVRLLLAYLFTTRGKHRVIAYCDPRNAASVALLQRLGMRREGHLRESTWATGEWTDDLVYALLNDEWQSR